MENEPYGRLGHQPITQIVVKQHLEATVGSQSQLVSHGLAWRKSRGGESQNRRLDPRTAFWSMHKYISRVVDDIALSDLWILSREAMEKCIRLHKTLQATSSQSIYQFTTNMFKPIWPQEQDAGRAFQLLRLINISLPRISTSWPPDSTLASPLLSTILPPTSSPNDPPSSIAAFLSPSILSTHFLETSKTWPE